MGVCEHAGLMQLQSARDGRRPVPAWLLPGNRQAWNDAEFLRVLKPAGLLAFQLPTWMSPRTLCNKLRLRTRACAALRAAGFDQRMLHERLNLVPVMQLQCIPEEGVLA